MKLYIRKISKDAIIVYKETTLQSVISDLISALVMLVLIGSDALFSIYIGRSFIIDLMIVVLFLVYIFQFAKSKKVKTTKEELIKML